MKKTISAVLLFLFFSLSTLCLKAQSLTLTAGTVCSNSVVSIPVSVHDMQGVFGYSLKLHYNNAIMTFTGYNVLNPTLFNSTVENHSNTGEIVMTVVPETTPLNIQNGYLYTFNFNVDTTASSSVLEWDSVFFIGQGGSIVASIKVNGAILTPPVFTLQPEDQIVCEGANNVAIFSIQTVDTAQAYLWQVSQNNGITWAYLVNDNHYQGVTTSVLTVADPKVQMDSNLYRCVLDGPCKLFSEAAMLTVLSNILTQPHDTVIETGGTAVFISQVSGDTPSYLWEVSADGGVTWSSTSLFPSITTAHITIVSPPSVWNGYQFRCIVTGQCSPPADTTEIATLWIGTASIEEQKIRAYEIYPNPATEIVFIETVKPLKAKSLVEIFDFYGRLLIKQELIDTKASIALQGLSSGIYFLKISNGNMVQNSKLIVVK